MNKIIAILMGLSLVVGVTTSAQAQVITGTITGNKFNDIDADGVRDLGEPGIGGVTIYLDTNADGTLDGGEATAVTDANGNFTFTGVAAGAVNVREEVQTGWTQIFPGVGANFQNAVTVTAGGTVSGVNFGNRLSAAATTGSINGTKFNDLDGDGNWDSGEPRLPGVTIYLDANNNNSLDNGETSVVTDATGSFAFVGLAAGTVTVREVIQSGWTQTLPGSGAGLEQTVNVTVGTNIPNINFGNRVTNAATATIGGTKYEDMDRDGVRDPNDPGVVGITIYIDANNNGMLDSGEVNMMTTTGGFYSFAGLVAGTYTVREHLTPNWAQVTPNASNNLSHTVTVQAGEIRADVDFGNRMLSSGSGIGGTIGGDVLGDGIGGDDALPVTGITLAALLALALGTLGARKYLADRK